MGDAGEGGAGARDGGGWDVTKKLARFRLDIPIVLPADTSLEAVMEFVRKRLPLAVARYGVENETVTDSHRPDGRRRSCDGSQRHGCPNEWQVRYREGRRVVMRLCKRCDAVFVGENKKQLAALKKVGRR